MLRQNRTATRSNLRHIAHISLLGAALALCGLPADALEVIEGKAILAHPAGRAVVEAGMLLKAGKLAEVKKTSSKEARDEWAALSAAEQKTEAAEAARNAPEQKVLEAEIARSGVLTNYGDSALLRTEAADSNSNIIAFVVLDAGKWKVTAGPKTIDTTPVEETAPPIAGALVLEHEIGKLVVAFAKQIEAGKFAAADELRSAAARVKRAAESAQERKESDAYWKSTLPAPAVLAEQIRSGGKLSFVGEKAYLTVSQNVVTPNADGSTSYSSSSMSVPFALDKGKWRVAD